MNMIEHFHPYACKTSECQKLRKEESEHEEV